MGGNPSRNTAPTLGDRKLSTSYERKHSQQGQITYQHEPVPERENFDRCAGHRPHRAADGALYEIRCSDQHPHFEINCRGSDGSRWTGPCTDQLTHEHNGEPARHFPACLLTQDELERRISTRPKLTGPSPAQKKLAGEYLELLAWNIKQSKGPQPLSRIARKALPHG